MRGSDKPVIYEVWASAGIRALWGRGIQHRFPRHAHASYQLGQVLTDARILQLADKQNLRIEAGEMFLLNPQQSHTCIPDGSGAQDYFVLSFDAEPMSRLLCDSPANQSSPRFTQAVWKDGESSGALSVLRGLLLEGADALTLEDATAQILNRLLAAGLLQVDSVAAASDNDSQPSFRTEPDWRLTRAKAYIEARFRQKLSLGEISAQAYLSEFHFQRCFLQAFGFSPLEYTEKLRVCEAERLLSRGESAAAVALAVGFSDQSHFCRVFRKLTGVTPQNYRQHTPE